MKSFVLTIVLLLFPLSLVFAHEEGTEITHIAEADWFSPLIAILVIIGAIIAARIMRLRLKNKY